jgi:hypothetical protein
MLLHNPNTHYSFHHKLLNKMYSFPYIHYNQLSSHYIHYTPYNKLKRIHFYK